jgi:hypothetical protein
MDTRELSSNTKILRSRAAQDLDARSPIKIKLIGEVLMRDEVKLTETGEQKLHQLLSEGYLVEAIHMEDPLRVVLAKLKT